MRAIGRWTLLGGSLVLGVLAGLAGFVIFEMKVPAGVLTGTTRLETRLYYLAAGLGLGFLIYGWTRLAAGVSASLAKRAAERAAAPPPAPARDPGPPIPPA